MQFRIGNGIDFHGLKEGIPLIIGGVIIPFSKGSKGHSDGDVLYHSIVDAIFGALALGDLGKYFSSNDMKWKDAPSKSFMEFAYNLLKEKGFLVENLDTTVILQDPVLKPYIINMRKNISSLLFTDIDRISVKATTTDSLGFIGQGKGVASNASIILKK